MYGEERDHVIRGDGPTIHLALYTIVRAGNKTPKTKSKAEQHLLIFLG